MADTTAHLNHYPQRRIAARLLIFIAFVLLIVDIVTLVILRDVPQSDRKTLHKKPGDRFYSTIEMVEQFVKV